MSVNELKALAEWHHNEAETCAENKRLQDQHENATAAKFYAEHGDFHEGAAHAILALLAERDALAAALEWAKKELEDDGQLIAADVVSEAIARSALDTRETGA